MNKNTIGDTALATETLKLREETTQKSDRGLSSRLNALKKNVRNYYSKKNACSFTACLIEKLYIKFLLSKSRVFAVFLLSFGIVSLVISFASSIGMGQFISDFNTFFSVVLLLLSFVLFTTNKNMYELLSQSRILSSISFVSGEVSILMSKSSYCKHESYYSTPFFLGIICGIFTAVYNGWSICFFLLLLCLSILVFNRPESGSLLVTAAIPFLQTELLFLAVCFTFASLINKYLLGKRHINFDISALLMLVASLYVVIRSIAFDFNIENKKINEYIVFFVFCVTVINLLRSTSMLKRVYMVILKMSRIFALIFAFFYLGSLFWGKETALGFLTVLGIKSLIHNLTSFDFLLPFLTLAIPLNFAFLFSNDKKSSTFINVFFILLMAAELLCLNSLVAIFICIVSSVPILSFYNRKYAFLIIPSPLAAVAVHKLYGLIPSRFIVFAQSPQNISWKEFALAVKQSLIFGAGQGTVNEGGNFVISFLSEYGIFGLVLIASVFVYMTSLSIKHIVTAKKRYERTGFLSMGLLVANIALVLLCVFSELHCNFNALLMYAAVAAAGFASGRCFEADYIESGLVREYNNK